MSGFSCSCTCVSLCTIGQLSESRCQNSVSKLIGCCHGDTVAMTTVVSQPVHTYIHTPPPPLTPHPLTPSQTGLSPDKVLKYSYQLAEIMLYLQQRGVVHQNLLPENIQVSSHHMHGCTSRSGHIFTIQTCTILYTFVPTILWVGFGETWHWNACYVGPLRACVMELIERYHCIITPQEGSVSA